MISLHRYIFVLVVFFSCRKISCDSVSCLTKIAYRPLYNNNRKARTKCAYGCILWSDFSAEFHISVWRVCNHKQDITYWCFQPPDYLWSRCRMHHLYPEHYDVTSSSCFDFPDLRCQWWGDFYYPVPDPAYKAICKDIFDSFGKFYVIFCGLRIRFMKKHWFRNYSIV